MSENNKKITLGVSGCIGAYKAVEILRELQKRGADVQVIMTRSACDFVQPLTFQILSKKAVITQMWTAEDTEIHHITMAQDTDLLLIAPATANIIGKLANGIADDFLSTFFISTTVPILIAPAMNTKMWKHKAVQENCRKLIEMGVTIIEPEYGELACGVIGEGRLAEPEKIAEQALAMLQEKKKDLLGEHILVTAGPTVEDIDPVRFLTNRSSGKMGYAIAEAAQKRGAKVTLISGPTKLSSPADVTYIPIRTTREMYEAVMNQLPFASIVIKAAAVCDYRPIIVSKSKIKKNTNFHTLELEETEDILVEVCRRKEHRLVVGFAAETEVDLKKSYEKLQSKGVDLLVVNDVGRSDAGFDVSTNQVTIISPDGINLSLPLMDKRAVAEQILDSIIKWKITKSLT